MNKDKLSVIVPIFNGENKIENCLNSIRKQNYNNLEIIVIDDGSTDSTFEICNMIAKEDERVKVYYKENGGVSSARNTGIEKASGKYLMFIDGDDIIDSDFVNRFMQKKELIDRNIVVISRIDTYVNGKLIHRMVDNLLEDAKIYNSNKLVDIWNSHLWNSPVNKIYLTDVLKQNKIRFDTEFAIGEDWLFNNEYARALRPEGYYVLNSVRYQYYMDSNPWRHCSRDEFYNINKYQVEDFKETLQKLNIADEEVFKFDKRDIDFTITEIRYIVRDKKNLSISAKITEAKELFEKENLKIRLKQHKKDFSFFDYLELSMGNVFLIYVWENMRKKMGQLRNR